MEEQQPILESGITGFECMICGTKVLGENPLKCECHDGEWEWSGEYGDWRGTGHYYKIDGRFVDRDEFDQVADKWRVAESR